MLDEIEDHQERFRIDARRRMFVLGGMGGLLLAGLGARLFHLQLLRGGLYRDMAEENRISLQPITAPRGRIFDRHGLLLVDNNPDYVLSVIPELTGGLAAILRRLQARLALSDKAVESILRQARRQRSFLPLRVKSHLTWEELSDIEVRLPHLPGVMIQTQSQRHYPHGRLGAHVLGYVGEVTDTDRQQLPDLRFRYGELVGKTGIERSYERQLRGIEGVREVEVNALGRQVRELHQQAAAPGQDLQLTIDLALQRDAEESLQGNTGAVVVLHVDTGEVLAMASEPSYDPNGFINGFNAQQWRRLITDKGRPLSNKTVQGQYPPGSTFKMVTALAGLQEGRITPYDRVYCPGFLMRENQRFNCWRRSGHGSVNLTQALEQSCDVYFYRLADRIGIDILERYARLFGFGEKTEVGLYGERAGMIPSRAWKQQVRKSVWYPGETLIAAIGQGYVTATPLQLACMTAAIANGGTLYRPTLIRHEDGTAPRIWHHTRLNAEHLLAVRTGMEHVVNGEYGTARSAKPVDVRAAGKTGTSQVVRMRSDAVPGKDIDNPLFRDHALYVTYAPTEHPEIAISVIVEHGGHGGQTAAPIAKLIIDRYFARKEALRQKEAGYGA